MNSIERKQEIIRRVQEHGSVIITDLAAEFQVSTMTIRRDLAKLAEEGLVNLEYRGASRNEERVFEYSIQQKMNTHSSEKMRIARRCLEYINEGDSIFIGAGTTTGMIAELVPPDMDLTILTNSLLAANHLSGERKAKVIMCPGAYRSMSMAYLGPLTIEFISDFRLDTLFLGTESVVPASGLAVPDISDGMTKKALIRQAGTVICATDSSKFHQPFLYQFCSIKDIDRIITDTDLDEEQKVLLEKAGIETDFV